MLDGIRSNAQSFWVKVAFGIIIVVFVFWGIGSYSGPKGLVASVNGKNITELEFQRAYMAMEENIRRSMPNVTSEMLESMNIEQRVLQGLIQEKLIESAAEKAGVTITPHELKAFISQLPYFMKDGKFDPDTYRDVLAKNNMDQRKFEADQAKSLLPAKLQKLVTAGAFAPEAGARGLFEYFAERRKVEYILFPAEAYKEKAVPTTEEIAGAYEKDSSAFAVPAKVKVEYVRLDPAVMGDVSAISDDEAKAAYEQRITQFTDAEKIHARHILIRVAPNAAEKDVAKAEAEIKALEERIRGGEDFAEVAKASGQDGTAAQGGDLGWFAREQMVPEFSKAAFDLKDGELSAPVRTQFGFHLIKKEEHQDAKVHPFEEVKDKLKQTLASEAAGKTLEEKADAVLAQALGGKSLAEAARASGSAAVKAETSESLSQEELPGKLGIRESDAQTIMLASAGTVLDSAVPAGASLLVVKVVESSPQTVKPLDEVRGEIASQLTLQKARGLALEAAKEARAGFADGKPAEGTYEVRTSEAFGRNGFIPGLSADPALGLAAFALPDVTPAWMDKPFAVTDGAALARLCAIEAPSDEDWKKAEPAITSSLAEERALNMFQTFIAQLGQEATVKTYNSPYLNRKSR
ncbi:MAG: SurA N-terminal domain-containing protein [Mailhella sp.]|nr:SurA N-terminal domain-containing protein [Mailhella sp.]